MAGDAGFKRRLGLADRRLRGERDRCAGTACHITRMVETSPPLMTRQKREDTAAATGRSGMCALWAPSFEFV